MFRAFILPVILMGMVGGPMLYSHHQRYTASHPNTLPIANAQNNAPWQAASYAMESSNQNSSYVPQNSNQFVPFQQNFQPTSFPRPLVETASTASASSTAQPNLAGSLTSQSLPTMQVASNPFPISTDDQAWALPGMTPDYAKAETYVFRGDANGPDLTSQPMSFTPTIDLSSLFRFDISKQWITSRWDRVSTCPAEQGIHGMRVALVTGTNSWDLHGSLTYYFDANHRVQRITYRGWTGDATRLLQTIQQQHQLRPQPTHWAGLYLSKRSGLLMKHPAVIDKSNPVQQLALILELNNPSGNSPLSGDFQALLPAAMASR